MQIGSIATFVLAICSGAAAAASSTDRFTVPTVFKLQLEGHKPGQRWDGHVIACGYDDYAGWWDVSMLSSYGTAGGADLGLKNGTIIFNSDNVQYSLPYSPLGSEIYLENIQLQNNYIVVNPANSYLSFAKGRPDNATEGSWRICERGLWYLALGDTSGCEPYYLKVIPA